MEVCEVCGSFLIVGDAQCRVEEHITGKQHVGYARIRETVEEIRKRRHKAKEERVKEREHDRIRRTEEVNSRRVSDSSSKRRSSSRHRDHSKAGREGRKPEDSKHRAYCGSRSKRHHSRSRSRMHRERPRSPYPRTGGRKSPSRHERSKKNSEQVSSSKRSSRDERHRMSHDRNGSDKKHKHEDKRSYRRSSRSITPNDKKVSKSRDDHSLKTSPSEKSSGKTHSERRSKRSQSKPRKEDRSYESSKRKSRESKHSNNRKVDACEELKETSYSGSDIEGDCRKKARYGENKSVKESKSKNSDNCYVERENLQNDNAKCCTENRLEYSVGSNCAKPEKQLKENVQSSNCNEDVRELNSNDVLHADYGNPSDDDEDENQAKI